MDLSVVQLIITGVVTAFTSWLGYKLRAQEMICRGYETRIKALENETETCLKERAGFKSALEEPWPSDIDKAQRVIMEAKEAMDAAGLSLTVEHVAKAIKTIKAARP